MSDLQTLTRTIKAKHLSLIAAAVAGQEAIKALQNGKDDVAAIHLAVMVKRVRALDLSLAGELGRETAST